MFVFLGGLLFTQLVIFQTGNDQREVPRYLAV